MCEGSAWLLSCWAWHCVMQDSGLGSGGLDWQSQLSQALALQERFRNPSCQGSLRGNSEGCDLTVRRQNSEACFRKASLRADRPCSSKAHPSRPCLLPASSGGSQEHCSRLRPGLM